MVGAVLVFLVRESAILGVSFQKVTELGIIILGIIDITNTIGIKYSRITGPLLRATSEKAQKLQEIVRNFCNSRQDFH